MSVLKKVLLLEDSAAYSDGLKLILVNEFPGVKIEQKDNEIFKYDTDLIGAFDLVIAGESICNNKGFNFFKSYENSTTPLLIVTDKNDGVSALNFIKMGAKAVLPKTAFPNEIVTACKTILNNRIYFSHDLIRSYSEGCFDGKRSGDIMNLLSKKEKTVLLLMSEGYRLKEICSSLGLANSTVSTMKKRIMEKLSINSAYELIQFMNAQNNTTRNN
jgi:two-component system response regulator EvgA